MPKSPTSRRRFLKLLGGSAALGSLPAMLGSPSIANAAASNSRVLVVGGGFAGATAAKYLRHWSPSTDVTLIEPNARYTSCILSNLVLNRKVGLNKLRFDYSTLRDKYGVNVVQDRVADIDGVAHSVDLGGGQTLNYDRLILAPGIQFDRVQGLDTQQVPHAWKAGTQTTLLRNQLEAMPNGGVFIMTIPPAPYRCPPGPYERACIVADYLKRRKPASKVIVLDANADIIVKKATFKKAFDQTFAGIVDYHANIQLLEVDSASRTAITNVGNFSADVLNVIPQQRAGTLIKRAGLANDATGRWAGVNPLSYESTAVRDIHVIGDSQATGQPKAGHIANAEAKVCADAVLRLLDGNAPHGAPMTNSACYSPITSNTASWLTAVFAYDAATGQMKVVPESSGSATRPNREHYRRMFDWADNLFADTFA